MPISRTMLKSKIHRATVTDANLNYVGSITIDTDLLERANIRPYEHVHIVNINNGARLETYAIEGPSGDGDMCLNGAAARLAQGLGRVRDQIHDQLAYLGGVGMDPGVSRVPHDLDVRSPGDDGSQQRRHLVHQPGQVQRVGRELGLARVRQQLLGQLGRAFAAVKDVFERAVQLSPSDPQALAAYSWYLLMVEGEIEQALDISEHLLRVAPFDLYYRAMRVSLFFYARHYERALEEVERLRELDPDYADIDVALSYFMLGRLEEAHHAWIAFFERCGTHCDWMREARERGWAEGGYEGSERAWLDAATNIRGYPPVSIAVSHAMLGEKDEALAWLERGYHERDSLMNALKALPLCDPLRSDPRFQDLLRRIGFPED